KNRHISSALAELIRSTRAPTKDRLIGKIMGGNPAFRGTRVPVHMLAELVPSRTRYRRGSVGLPLSRTSTRSECATASLGSRATARAETCGSSRDRQFAEVEGIAFHYQFLPGCT